jgi:putative molybdopterin biosynthesis protein
MASDRSPRNRVRDRRIALGFTQAELASKAGISRTAITAIEGQRLVPSVTAAMSIARSLDMTVEALFGSDEASQDSEAWATEPLVANSPYWTAEVSGKHWRFPFATTPTLSMLPDYTSDAKKSSSSRTFVMATCDPAAGLLATIYERVTGMRMIVLSRSSRDSLTLLKEGKVHCAGIHYTTRVEPSKNAQSTIQTVGSECQLLHIAWWNTGIASCSSARIRSVRSAVKSKLSWVWREPGACARISQERLLGADAKPRRVAYSHLAVAQAIRAGWGDAGICVQLASAESGLQFLPIQSEAYDLCIPNAIMSEIRIQSLIQVVRSDEYRTLLDQLPGYITKETGSLTKV